MVLGVPVQEAQLEPGPIFDGDLGQQQAAGAVASGKLDEALDAVPTNINGTTYYLSNGVYFMPVLQNGVIVYTTVRL